MSTLVLRERQIQLTGWSVSALLMLLGWLVLAQLDVHRPRQNPAPTEQMMGWVRTIMPTPARDRVMRQRVRERLGRQLARVEPRPMQESERLVSRPRPAADLGRLPSGAGERRALDLPRLPGREGIRPSLPARSLERETQSADQGMQGLRRGGMDLRTEAPQRRQARPAAGATLTERALALPGRTIDPVLASFLGCPGTELPGADLPLAGAAWQAWFCGDGGGLRVLLRQGDDVSVLVLTGADLQLQSFQRGTATRTRGGLVVQAERTRSGDGAGLRKDLLEALEER